MSGQLNVTIRGDNTRVTMNGRAPGNGADRKNGVMMPKVSLNGVMMPKVSLFDKFVPKA